MNHAQSNKLNTAGEAIATRLIARPYYSGFDLAHDTYNALTAASNGKIYYVLSSESPDKGGQFYCYDPKTDVITFLGDLTELCGESGMKRIPQGKSHVEFYECECRLYFATHVGFYEMIGGMERLPQNPPDGLKRYRGGHILSYDLATGTFKDHAVAPDGEGILTMSMDPERGQIYGITWPKGYFIHYDLNRDRLTNAGLVSANGEAGIPGEDYRVLCRSMVVDPRDGAVYFSNSEGDILVYRPSETSITRVEGVHLRLDYFGQYDPKSPGSMAYNWRKIFWHPVEEVAYGVHGNSGYLFRFNPRKPAVEIVERITSLPSRKSGMFDQFSYGYLGFQLGPDKETIYYLTGGPVYLNGERVNGEKQIAKGGARGLENLHLVTYHLSTETYQDRGPVFYADGTRPAYVNSMAIGHEGHVYMLARYEHRGKVIQDLVKIRVPFQMHKRSFPQFKAK
jgi:hypothetical protein